MARTVHIQLGRNGDLILLLPCWHQIFLATGERPVVIASRDFAGVLEGVSYVEVDAVNCPWYLGMPLAKQMAGVKYGQYVVTQCHGTGHSTDKSKYGSFGEAMWSKAGFPNLYGTLPLVFDRRDPGREGKLLARYRRSGWPLLLYNFTGNSSPLPAMREVWQRLYRWRKEFNLVNLGLVRAERIYDLLGLYDAAAGLVTIDTSTLHLAAASGVPMLAYCRGGWSSAIPKPGSVRVDYEQALARLGEVDGFVAGLKQPVEAYA